MKKTLGVSDKEIPRMARVCKHWRFELYKEFKRFDFNALCEKGRLTDSVLAGLALGIGPNLKKIDITEVEELFYENQGALYQKVDGLLAIGKACARLEELTIPIPLNADQETFADMTEALVLIANNCKNLKRLNISNQKFNETVFVQLSTLLKLEKLVVSAGPSVSGIVSLKSESLINLSIGAADYKFLDKQFVQNFHKGITDDVVKKISSNIPNLQNFELFCAIYVTEAGIKEFAASAKGLTLVRITGYEKENDEGPQDPSSGRVPPGFPVKAIEYFAQCKKLQHFEVLQLEIGKDDWSSIEKVINGCPSLIGMAFSKVNPAIAEKIHKKKDKLKLIVKS